MRQIVIALAIFTSTSAAPVFADNEAAKPKTTASTNPDQQMKCRKVEVTGSLLKKGRVCRTIAEWKQIQANGNRVARAVVEEGAKPTN